MDISLGFKYEPQLSEGVLRLQETGILATLKTKWWKQRKGGGACSVSGRLSRLCELNEALPAGKQSSSI